MKDYRNRTIQFDENGKRIKHQPTKSIEHCFEIQDIDWEIYFTSIKDNQRVFLEIWTAEGERNFKKNNKELFIFD